MKLEDLVIGKEYLVKGNTILRDGTVVKFYGDWSKGLVGVEDSNGCVWCVSLDSLEEIPQVTTAQDSDNSTPEPKIAASYYDLPFKDWTTLNDMVDYLGQERWGYLSYIFKDILKGAVRWGDKDGTSKEYDAQKLLYYSLQLIKSVSGKDKAYAALEELMKDPQFNTKGE